MTFGGCSRRSRLNSGLAKFGWSDRPWPSHARIDDEKMPYVVAEPCIGVKDKSCMTVCPVDCIYELEDMVVINPDECIDCGLCEPECPVTAIFVDTDVPPNWVEYIEKNRTEGRKKAEGA